MRWGACFAETEPSSDIYGCTLSARLHTFRTPAICQPSFDLSAQLQSDSCTSNCRFGNLSTLAAADQLSCTLSARLPHSTCQLRCTFFSPAIGFQPVCNQLARLQSVGTAAQCHLLCSSALHFVSPATAWQLSCILAAQLQSICSSVFCHAIHLL